MTTHPPAGPSTPPPPRPKLLGHVGSALARLISKVAGHTLRLEQERLAHRLPPATRYAAGSGSGGIHSRGG